MAYINKAEVAAIRAELKEAFGKEIKFSVVKDPSSLAVTVSIMQSPTFADGLHEQVNHHWMNEHYSGNQLMVLERVQNIIRTAPAKVAGGSEWYDKSDSMTDYFDIAFYYHIQIGKWDKPHKKV